jgi:hypothetical protein
MRRAHSRVGVGIEAVVIKIAQAVIAEAEPHRRRFPNFACGRSSRTHSREDLYGAHFRQRPVRGRDPAGAAALGIVVLTG